MRLNTIYDLNKKKKAKRVGRGIGSGKGKTCGAGHKGQRARTGVAIKGFEGGQMPLTRRLPKRGFNNPNKVYNKVVNLGQIQTLIAAGKLTAGKIEKYDLKAVGLISSPNQSVKLLSKGTFSTTINITVDFASKEAEKMVVEAGGKVITILNTVAEEVVVSEKKQKKSK